MTLEDRIANATGKPVARLEYPGGKSRKSIRAILEDGTRVFATQRRTAERGELEAEILRTLGAADAPAPRLLSFTDGLMMQQDVGELRLTEALVESRKDAKRCADLLSTAIVALAAGQRAIERSPLKRSIPKKGVASDWRKRLIGVPRDIGRMLDVPAPKLDATSLVETISVRDDHCVKWDARPGNAILGHDGEVRWIDWDHMGRRNKIDDLVWLLADEYVELEPMIEARLLNEHLPEFRGRRTPQAALQYFYAFGALHLCVRLELILGYRLRDGKWWDLRKCIAKDKVGMTKDCCLSLCVRGARWAAASWNTLPLVNWFHAVSKRISADLP